MVALTRVSEVGITSDSVDCENEVLAETFIWGEDAIRDHLNVRDCLLKDSWATGQGAAGTSMAG